MVYLLAWLGVIPFVLLLCVSQFYPAWGPQCARALNIYASMIACFMAGSHWGIVHGTASGWPWLILSNCIALMSCIALWLDNHIGLLISGGCLGVLLLADYGQLQRHWITLSYWYLRLMITSVVLILLCLYGLLR